MLLSYVYPILYGGKLWWRITMNSPNLHHPNLYFSRDTYLEAQLANYTYTYLLTDSQALLLHGQLYVHSNSWITV